MVYFQEFFDNTEQNRALFSTNDVNDPKYYIDFSSPRGNQTTLPLKQYIRVCLGAMTDKLLIVKKIIKINPSKI